MKVESRYARFLTDADSQSFAERQLALGDAVNGNNYLPTIGRRFVIRYSSTHRYAILAQCGRKVRLIESESLPHALEFEKRFVLDCSHPGD